MRLAARDFLRVLEPAQREKAVFALADDERKNWHVVPMVRKGIPLDELRPDQEPLVYSLLSSALSHAGLKKTTAIISLEKILFELENQAPHRNAEKYYVSIFGEPKEGEAWGWRFEGHHVAFNVTVAPDATVSLTPTFFGANPGKVQDGPRAGLEALAAEGSLGRALVKSLTEEQNRAARFSDKAPPDIFTFQTRTASRLQPEGVSVKEFTPEQKELLWKLIGEYVDRFRPDLTAPVHESLKAGGGDSLYFAWAGEAEEGKGFYYRVQSPQFLIEYDNTQNGANHPHTVWRDFDGDFGEDILKKHYEKEHSGPR